MISPEERAARAVIREANRARKLARPKQEKRAKVEGSPGEATPRKRLTGAQRTELMHRQQYVCGCGCGAPLVIVASSTRVWWVPMIDEHILPLELGGSNDLSNRALYCVPCAKKKTRSDIAQIAKMRRQSAKHFEGPRAAKRPLRSRGFG